MLLQLHLEMTRRNFVLKQTHTSAKVCATVLRTKLGQTLGSNFVLTENDNCCKNFLHTVDFIRPAAHVKFDRQLNTYKRM